MSCVVKCGIKKEKKKWNKVNRNKEEKNWVNENKWEINSLKRG